MSSKHNQALTPGHPSLKHLARQQNLLSFGMTGLFCASFLLYGAVSVFFPDVLAHKVSHGSPMTYALLVSMLLIVAYVAGALYYLYAMNNQVEPAKQKAQRELALADSDKP